MSGTGRADFGPRSLADVTAMLAVLPAGAVIRIGDQTFSRTPSGQVAITGAVLIDGVNDIALASAAAGSAPSIQTVGADATIGLTLALKGNGTLNLQGGLAVGANTLAATASMNLNAAPGQVKQVAFQSGGVGRWVAGSTPAAETGGNAGSDYVVSRFDDAGNFLGNSIAINRATGVVSMGQVAIGASLTAPLAAVSAFLAGQSGRAGRAWDGGAIVENTTYTLIADAPYPLTIVGLHHLAGTTGMSFTANVLNGGTSVTGLGAVAVTATAGTAAATGNTAVAEGGIVTVAVTAAAGSPTGGRLVLRFTRA